MLCFILAQLSTSEAVTHFKLEEGYRIELVVSEPQISSPVSAAFDERARLWVVEMLDYPTPDTTKPPLGRIKILEDRDRDGRYEHASIFADQLLLANGVMPWRGGAIVTCSPHILFLEDTDGDGTADRRTPLFEGFSTGNAQLRVSHPTLGLDGWITVANGAQGGKIRAVGREGARTLDIAGMDFKFDPFSDRYEADSGYGQFGLAFDEWGGRFVCTNRNHLVHLPIPARYFARNPFLAAPPARGDNQSRGGSARVFPISGNKTLAASHAGTFTASCGIIAWRGDILTCEPTGNLVHREILTPEGGSYTARPAKDGVEFLASDDAWFRPVDLFHGPDGALYVVDMCRSEVEHPHWVPADAQHRYDFNGPKDRGRIWRVGTGPRTPAPDFSSDRVALLERPEPWVRMTAHRLLLENRGGADLKRLLTSTEPRARIHALHLLEQEHALKLLDDPHPRVREHAVRLAEAWPERLLKLAEDTDPRVRFQTALSLSAWDSDQKLDALAKIPVPDRWTRLAVACAVPTLSGALIERVQDPALLRDLAGVAGGRRDKGEIERLLAHLKDRDATASIAVLSGLAEGLGRRGGRLADYGAELPPAILAAASEGDGEAIRLLAHARWETAGPILDRLLHGHPSQPARLAAVSALAAHGTGDVLLKDWQKQLPPVRREIFEAMSRRPDRVEALLNEVESGRLLPAELGAALVKRLAGTPRGKALLQAPPAGETQAILDRFRPALEGRGDPRAGKPVFEKLCIACHRVGDIGVNVGPDISDTLSKPVATLLADIIDPNRAIDGNYVTYEVRTRDGASATGFIAEQTAASVTLRRGQDQQDVILTSEIEEIRSTRLSLMPEGLEKGMTVEQMRDLLAYLKNWREMK